MNTLNEAVPLLKQSPLHRQLRLVEDVSRKFRKLLRLLPTRSYRRGLRFKVAASVEHQAIMRGVQIATLVDVGANVGQFSLLIRTLHPMARIFAFEPLSQAAGKFATLFDGDKLTSLHRFAVGEQSANTTMFVAKDDDSSSLLAATDDQVGYAAGARAVGTEPVEVRRLDEVLSAVDIVRPALLKLDVQGYELLALRSCGDLLRQFDQVYVEVSFITLYQGQSLAGEIVQFLFGHGFLITAVNNPVFDRMGRCLQADFLFRQAPSGA